MKPIQDYSGKVIALMESNSQQEKIYTPIGFYLGYYDKALDKTYASGGNYIGPRNQIDYIN